jgi:hypothetical protein
MNRSTGAFKVLSHHIAIPSLADAGRTNHKLSKLHRSTMNSFVDDDIDDSLMLAALAQVESSFAAKQQSASIASVPAATSVATTSTSTTLPRVVQPRSFENLTNQHIPRNCKCGKPATVKVVVKQGKQKKKKKKKTRFKLCADVFVLNRR